MKNLENELREAYRAVTDAIREQDLPGLYEKRARTRRWRRRWFSAVAPLAAAAAVVVVTGISVAVLELVSSPSPGQSAAALPASFAPAPPFMVILNAPGAPRPMLVVSAATGRAAAQVPAPGDGHRMGRRRGRRQRRHVRGGGHAGPRRPVRSGLPVHADAAGQRKGSLAGAVDRPGRASGDRVAERQRGWPHPGLRLRLSRGSRLPHGLRVPPGPSTGPGGPPGPSRVTSGPAHPGAAPRMRCPCGATASPGADRTPGPWPGSARVLPGARVPHAQRAPRSPCLPAVLAAICYTVNVASIIRRRAGLAD